MDDEPEGVISSTRHKFLSQAAVPLGIVLALMVSWAVIEFNPFSSPSSPEPIPVPTEIDPTNHRPPRADEDAPVAWFAAVADLRSGLIEGQFETTPDGFMDSDAIIDAGPVWAVITRERSGGDNVVHGLDAETGEELWSTPMDGVYCADRLLDEYLACAEVTAREQGLGTQWTLHLIDPATGATAVETPFSGWLTGVAVDHGHLIILEQRLPAPHTVVTGFDAALTPVWQEDLSWRDGHDMMFSENRTYLRAERVPDGPALDRPRIRRVGDGLTALWIGARTVFLDVPGGRVVEMPHCSRLVDDGTRLWCNAGPRAVAYDYEFRQLASTPNGIRLAFPNRDPRAGDVTIPAFLNEQGALMRVDLATGEPQGRLVSTGLSSVFGMDVQPSVATVGGALLVADKTQTAALSPDGELLWRSDLSFSLREPFARGGDIVLGDFHIQVLDPRGGEIRATWHLEHGFSLTAKGETLATYGLDEISRLELP